MDNKHTPADKEAITVIEKLGKSLQAIADSFEYATSNPQRYITVSIFELRVALFELAKWQVQNVVAY